MMSAPKGVKIYDANTSDLIKLSKKLKEFQKGNKDGFTLIENKYYGRTGMSYYDGICMSQRMDLPLF